MWNPFKRRGKEEAPEQAPAAPAQPTRPAPEEKKPGLFRRLTGRGKPKPGKAPEAPRKGAPPAEAPAGGEAAPEAAPEQPEREYPKGLGVSADGTWQISSTQWNGIMHGALHGEDVKVFIDAMEAGDLETAARLVANAYDENVGALIDVSRSQISRIGY